MGYLYEKAVRPLLFRMEPEQAHEYALSWLSTLAGRRSAMWLLRQFCAGSWQQPVRCLGLEFPNAVGAAAGFDKNAEVWPALAALGFGHIEVGTVTLHAQSGNDRPRIFRYPEHEGIINRMGFPNEGAVSVAKRLKALRMRFGGTVPLGVNIGKSRGADLEEAAEDYAGSYRLLSPWADYVAINISSPNTPHLRKLQQKRNLIHLLKALRAEEQAAAGNRRVPLVVKLAPDLSFRELDDVLEAVTECGVAGVIAANTTKSRPVALGEDDETGGLSGRPLQALALEIVNYIHKATEGRLPIIGVGGIDDPVSAGRMMDAGARLVQLYTGLVYRGPLVARNLARALSWRQRAWV